MYPTISESVSVSELKCGKKCYPDPIPCVSDPIPSLKNILVTFLLEQNVFSIPNTTEPKFLPLIFFCPFFQSADQLSPAQIAAGPTLGGGGLWRGILYIFRVIETLTIAQPMNQSPATYGPIGQR